MASEQASNRKSLIEKCRDYFDGDIGAHYGGLTARFSHADLASDEMIRKYEVPVENAARIAVTRLCGLVPTEADFTLPGQAGLTADLAAWVEGDFHGPGIGLRDWIPEILLRLCVDGECPIKVILRNGIPIGRCVDDAGFSIVTHPANILDISAYFAVYELIEEKEEGVAERKIVETFTPWRNEVTQDGRVVGQETWDHGLGWIPLVLIKRADVIGDKHGRSLMADLIEAQDNINRCNAFINRANKYGAFPMFAPKDDAIAPESAVTLGPGRIPTFPIERITADGAHAAVFAEREFWVQHLYALCGMKQTTRDEIAQAPNASGKALLVLNAEGKRMVAGILSRLRRGFRQYCRMALALMKGGAPEDYNVVVTFPSLDREDPASLLERARALKQDFGLEREGLRVLGYSDEKIEDLLKERG